MDGHFINRPNQEILLEIPLVLITGLKGKYRSKLIGKGVIKMLLQKIQNIELPDLNGNKVSLSDYHGKNTLIFMWASW